MLVLLAYTMQLGREGEQGERSPPDLNRKNVVEIWFYLPGVDIFGKEAEIMERFNENVRKGQFSIEILIKTPQIFLRILQDFGHIP